MGLCFSKNDFGWIVNSRARQWFKQPPTNRLMNIWLKVDLWKHSIQCDFREETELYRDSTYTRWQDDSNVICDILMDFGGAEILRENVQITFTYCSVYTHRIIPTTNFQVLTTLTGFQRVGIEFSMDRTTDETRHLSKCEHLRTAMIEALEPTLGPVKMGPVGPMKHRSCFEFHPREHFANLQQTNAAGVGHLRAIIHLPEQEAGSF